MEESGACSGDVQPLLSRQLRAATRIATSEVGRPSGPDKTSMLESKCLRVWRRASAAASADKADAKVPQLTEASCLRDNWSFAWPFAMKRLPRVLWTAMPAGRTAAEAVVEQPMEVAEMRGFREAEPDQTRFARLETKAVQRPKSGAAPVSEVRTAPANPLEIWEKSGAGDTPFGVRNGMMAEGTGLPSNLLHP